MTTEATYAMLAAAAYDDIRDLPNRSGAPAGPGWPPINMA